MLQNKNEQHIDVLIDAYALHSLTHTFDKDNDDPVVSTTIDYLVIQDHAPNE